MQLPGRAGTRPQPRWSAPAATAQGGPDHGPGDPDKRDLASRYAPPPYPPPPRTAGGGDGPPRTAGGGDAYAIRQMRVPSSRHCSSRRDRAVNGLSRKNDQAPATFTNAPS